ncbi:hypothetical protein D3C72_1330070 [compost metagenome]
MLNASWTMRNMAIAVCAGTSASAPSTLTANPYRLAKSSANHSMAGIIPNSSSKAGRRSLAMRRTEATVLSMTPFMAPISSSSPAVSRPSSTSAPSIAMSILSALRRWPRSSCSSRAMRRLSSSRAASIPSESCCSSSRERRRAASARARSVISRSITVYSFVPSWAVCEMDASIGNSVPSRRRA